MEIIDLTVAVAVAVSIQSGAMTEFSVPAVVSWRIERTARITQDIAALGRV